MKNFRRITNEAEIKEKWATLSDERKDLILDRINRERYRKESIQLDYDLEHHPEKFETFKKLY